MLAIASAEPGLAWSFELETERGVEATPFADDGVMYARAWESAGGS